MIKKEYIIVEALFEQDDSDNNQINYEDLGIKAPKQSVKSFDVLPRVIITDKIMSFGPGDLVGVTTIHMVDGLGFRVKGSITDILTSIYPEADISKFEPTEEDFEI